MELQFNKPAGRVAGRMVRCLAVLGEEVYGVFAEGQTLWSHFVQRAHEKLKGSVHAYQGK